MPCWLRNLYCHCSSLLALCSAWHCATCVFAKRNPLPFMTVHTGWDTTSCRTGLTSSAGSVLPWGRGWGLRCWNPAFEVGSMELLLVWVWVWLHMCLPHPSLRRSEVTILYMYNIEFYTQIIDRVVEYTMLIFTTLLIAITISLVLQEWCEEWWSVKVNRLTSVYVYYVLLVSMDWCQEHSWLT